jgi:hypothetical protein
VKLGLKLENLKLDESYVVRDEISERSVAKAILSRLRLLKTQSENLVALKLFHFSPSRRRRNHVLEEMELTLWNAMPVMNKLETFIDTSDAALLPLFFAHKLYPNLKNVEVTEEAFLLRDDLEETDMTPCTTVTNLRMDNHNEKKLSLTENHKLSEIGRIFPNVIELHLTQITPAILPLLSTSTSWRNLQHLTLKYIFTQMKEFLKLAEFLTGISAIEFERIKNEYSPEDIEKFHFVPSGRSVSSLTGEYIVAQV